MKNEPLESKIIDLKDEIASLKFWNKEYKKNYKELEEKLNTVFADPYGAPLNVKPIAIRTVIKEFFKMYKPR